MFIKKPNLPENNVELVVVDANAPTGLFEYLQFSGIKYIKSTVINNVIDSVSTHPDMQLCGMGNGKFVCEPSTYEYYKKELEVCSVNLTSGETAIKSNYPFDVAYNVVITGEFLLHNLKYTDGSIIEFAKNYGISIYDTKQGYTMCATCVIDDKAIVTDDVGIHKICGQYGIDSLLVEKDEIILGDRKDGFLGGCCGMIGYKKLLFCGNIKRHRSYRQILAFAEKYGVELVSAFDGPLTDIGSIIPVIEE